MLPVGIGRKNRQDRGHQLGHTIHQTWCSYTGHQCPVCVHVYVWLYNLNEHTNVSI